MKLFNKKHSNAKEKVQAESEVSYGTLNEIDAILPCHDGYQEANIGWEICTSECHCKKDFESELMHSQSITVDFICTVDLPEQ